MPFSCNSRSAAAAKSGSRKTVKVKGRSKAISVDLHCHIHTDTADVIAKQSGADFGLALAFVSYQSRIRNHSRN